NFTAGTVSVIDTSSLQVVDRIGVGGRPMAIAITNNRHDKDDDETVFVTQFYAELIPGGAGEGFDTGKRGVVQAFPVGDPGAITRITLSPLAKSGFTADRTKFCKNLNSAAANDTFCPDPSATAANDTITKNPQAVFPNQFHTALIRGNRLYLPNIGAQPEP